MNSKVTVKPGRYRHYKGRSYEFICLAYHTETEEPMVIYQALYGTRKVWARPYSLWIEEVEVNGTMVPRFRWIGD